MLPTNDDFMKVVSNGIRWTGIVGRGGLTESERRAVVQFLRTSSPRFANDILQSPIIVSPEPARSRGLVA